MPNIVANSIIILGKDSPINLLVPIIENMKIEEFNKRFEDSLIKYYYAYKDMDEDEINEDIRRLKKSKDNNIYVLSAECSINLDFVRGYGYVQTLDEHVKEFTSVQDFYNAWILTGCGL